MISTLKSETARVNGAKSKGPTTAEGREKSSRNALKHGLCADDDTVLLDCEDPARYNEFLVKFRGIHEPATPAEEDVFEEMAIARWRLRRMRTVELGLLNAEILAQQSTSDSSKLSAHLALAFRGLADDSRSLALASRYEARLQRLYERAHKTLRELQQARLSQTPEPPHTIHVRWVDQEEEPDPPSSPTEPRASASGPVLLTNPEKLRNEPTVAAIKEVSPVAQASVPVSANPAPTLEPQLPIGSEPTHPKSEIRNPKSGRSTP
jgi:hypothetical protein